MSFWWTLECLITSCLILCFTKASQLQDQLLSISTSVSPDGSHYLLVITANWNFWSLDAYIVLILDIAKSFCRIKREAEKGVFCIPKLNIIYGLKRRVSNQDEDENIKTFQFCIYCWNESIILFLFLIWIFIWRKNENCCILQNKL